MNVTWSRERTVKAAAMGVLVVAAVSLGGGTASATREIPNRAAAADGVLSVLNGVYRLKWSEKELIAAGVPRATAHADFGYANGNPIVITMTLREGHFVVRGQPKAFWSPCNGSYAVSGKTVSIKEGPPYNCSGQVNARWSLQNGQLRLRVTRASAEDTVFFGAKPWKKIA